MDWIQVPVPADRVQDVFRLVLEGLASKAAQEEPGPDDREIVTGWTAGEIGRAVRESPSRMKKVLTLLAERAPSEVRGSDLASSVEYEPRQFAGLMGAWGHRVKARYRKTKWPFDWREDEEGRFHYRMSVAAAVVVLDAARAT